jgi:anhydro-N-acetylmuramic acid kinase
MKEKNKYRVLGLMSGTSLDGLDIVYCKLIHKKKKWKFEIINGSTLSYSAVWKKKLSGAHTLKATDLLSLHSEYGIFLGQSSKDFIAKHKIRKIDFISSHGHTIFHQPERNFTFQLGEIGAIHNASQLPVVADFRSLDVTMGGEGAPLVPIGDRYLFHDFDVCLNLGGISNLSAEVKGLRKAFDVCFVNMGLNYLSQQAGKEFDRNGELAAAGKINSSLLQKLAKVYTPLSKKRPSLGREGFEKWIQPLLKDKKISLNDRLRTFNESIAREISNAVPKSDKKIKLLATGGGAFNTFLIQLLKEKLKGRVEVIIPEKKIIDFKEALVFALLGVLRVRNEINVLKSVTGAKGDSSSGVITGM